MRRALLAVILIALALAAPASAKRKHFKPGLHAIASVDPPVQLFGDTVTARLTVIADTRTPIDPARLRIAVDFAPFSPVARPRVTRTGSGTFLQTTWTWKLRCLEAACVPVAPPSDVAHDFQFAPARVRYLGPNGELKARLKTLFPPIETVSEVGPGERAFVKAHKRIFWTYQLAPATGDAYRLSPGLVFWLAVALAGLCGVGAAVLAGRWALRLRTASAAAAPGLPPSYLERALALFFWANAHGDETLQRKALERVADELPLDVLDLSEAARALAWSPETPEGDEVEAISERVGVPVHPEDGSRA
jgi:hypothetical protein